MAEADADILLRVRVQVDENSPARLGDNWAAKAANVASLKKAAFNFRGKYILEFINAAHGEELVQGVDAAAPARFALRGQEEGGLIDAVRVPVLGEELIGQFRALDPGHADERALIFFTREGGEAYLRDLPHAEMHRLDSGHGLLVASRAVVIHPFDQQL